MAQYINREKLLKRMEGYCKANCGCKPHEDALCPSCGLGDAIYMVEEQRIVNSRNMRGRKGATVDLSKTEKTTKPDERLTPKKPKVSVDTWVCPKCGRDVEYQVMLGENILFHGNHNFCPNCGQAIDWTDY